MWLEKFWNVKLKSLAAISASLLFVSAIFSSLLLYLQQDASDVLDSNLSWESYKSNGFRHPILLWWTPFTGENGILKNCDDHSVNAKCFFSNDRSFITNENLQALLFYGSSFSPWDLPPRATERPLWALLHEESPRNSALMQHNDALNLFNLSATFSRHSDFPLTLQHLESLEDLIGDRFVVPWNLKVRHQQELGLASVVYIQSDCDTATDRDSYVQELMKHIRVDSYGSCIQNKKLPLDIQDAMSSLHSEAFWKFQAQYKFSISFENGECNDYITEKLWRPLVIGSVPIYYGAENFKDWLPFNNSAINARDFISPKALADYILVLDSDEKKYQEHLRHKEKGQLLNSALVKFMESRTWSVGQKLWGNFEAKTLVEEYECFVCRKIHSNRERDRKWIVSNSHYDCPVPRSSLTKNELPNSFWAEQWHQGKYEAKVLKRIAYLNEVVTQKEYYDIVTELMTSDL